MQQRAAGPAPSPVVAFQFVWRRRCGHGGAITARNWLIVPSDRVKGLGLLAQACRWSESSRKLGRVTKANHNRLLFWVSDDLCTFRIYMHKDGEPCCGSQKRWSRGDIEGGSSKRQKRYSQVAFSDVRGVVSSCNHSGLKMI